LPSDFLIRVLGRFGHFAHNLDFLRLVYRCGRAVDRNLSNAATEGTVALRYQAVTRRINDRSNRLWGSYALSLLGLQRLRGQTQTGQYRSRHLFV